MDAPCVEVAKMQSLDRNFRERGSAARPRITSARRAYGYFVVWILCDFACGVVRANSDVTVEATDVFDGSDTCPNLAYNVQNVTKFRTRMLSISGFTAGSFWTNATVYPTDFVDAQTAVNWPYGLDYANFDKPTDAISYLSTHGECAGQPFNFCDSSHACPTFSGMSGVCIRELESPTSGICRYPLPRQLVTFRSNVSACQDVDYSDGEVRLGETKPWAGAGTDGNVNLAVLDVSCGAYPYLWTPNLINTFAGVSIVATIMPTTFFSDTADTSSRGDAFGHQYTMDQNQSAALSWVNAMSETSGGIPCKFGGGNHGISGCGAVIAYAADATQSGATWAAKTESWNQLRNESNDALGSGFQDFVLACNYDCWSAHPFGM